MSNLTCGYAYEKTEQIRVSDQDHGRLSKPLEKREKSESEVERIHQQIVEAVRNGNRRARVERLVTSCEDAMKKAIKTHDQLLELTLQVDDSASALKKKETWLNVLTTSNDEVFERARQYIDSLPASDKTSQSSCKSTKKSVSNRCGSSVTSKISSQRRNGFTHCRTLERRT